MNYTNGKRSKIDRNYNYSNSYEWQFFSKHNYEWRDYGNHPIRIDEDIKYLYHMRKKIITTIINQPKGYAHLEIDNTEKDAVIIWFNETPDPQCVHIHRSLVSEVIAQLKKTIK